MRALPPEDVVKEAQALSLAPTIAVLEEAKLKQGLEGDEFVVSDDEIMRELVPKYLNGKKLEFDTTFLRWGEMNSITKTPVQNDTQISSKDFDKKIIDLAFKEAEKSSDWWRHVGAILVKDGEIVSSAYNKHAVTENTHYIDGEPRSNFKAGKAIADLVIFQHGEAALIAQSAREGVSTTGAELYVTTFPCPTCAMLIANSGIKKVYYREGYSLLDAERILKNANVELIQIL